MEKKQWRVGDLQTMQGADPRAVTMIGFVLYDETGQPCVTFGYGTHDEARAPLRVRTPSASAAAITARSGMSAKLAAAITDASGLGP